MGNEMEQLIERGHHSVMNTYSRFPVALDHGKGVYVWDADGKKYLDFVAGIAVNSLGCGHEKLCKVIGEQATKLIHCSNLYYTKPQIDLADLLVGHSSFQKVFFCNSGAESIEAALKLCRKYASMKGKSGYEIITMENSFHGRTFGAVTATGQEKYQKGLGPLLPEIFHVPFNDFDALSAAVNENTCGIFLEPIQGEGGMIPAEKAYLEQVRKLCDKKDILLVFDEIQCGVGRTGKLFAHENYGVTPDAATLAKGLAGGVPIGALLASEKAAAAFIPGDHASTFGGNSLSTAAGMVVMEELFSNGLLEHVKEVGEYLGKVLESLKEKHGVITAVRGMGLMQGIEISAPVAPIIAACMEQGLLLVGAGSNVIRFVPPLITEKSHIDEMAKILSNILKS